MNDEPDDEQRRHVLTLLAQHGLSPHEDELDVLVAAYPVFRMIAGSSYTVRGVRYAEPATIFTPVSSGG